MYPERNSPPSHRSSLSSQGPNRGSISEHRRSVNGSSLRGGSRSPLNRPSSPAVGVGLSGSPNLGTADPHHHRAPSLGDLHQELEEEQEAQVVCSSILILSVHCKSIALAFVKLSFARALIFAYMHTVPKLQELIVDLN